MVTSFFKLIQGKGGAAAVEAQSLIRCSTDEARKVLPPECAERLSVLPLGIITLNNKRFLSAAAGNCSAEVEKELRFICGMEVKLIPVTRSVAEKAVFLAYQGSDSALEKSSQRLKQRGKYSFREEKNRLGIRNSTGEANRFLEALLAYAIGKKASDIHFLPYPDGLFLKLRVNGELRTHDAAICSLPVYEQVVGCIKILAGLDHTRRDVVHDGAIQFSLPEATIDIRVSIMPTVHGEKIVLRLHGTEQLLELESLSLDDRTAEFIGRSIDAMQGIILCAGPTSSGKSTTLYAMLQKIAAMNKSIITIEDPVEIKLPFASQTNINEKKGVRYFDALKAALRQDPDCIMIGELRDAESTALAFQAALTGHLVLASIHAGLPNEVFKRITSFGVDSLTFAQTCRLIICQKLAPALCQACKVYDLTASRNYGITSYKGVGCSTCDYCGYSGRVPLTESVYFDKAVITQSVGNLDFHSLYMPQDYVTFEDNIHRLLKDGKISSLR